LDTFLQTHEAAIRLGFFIGIFAVMALWEQLAPRRILTVGKAIRWTNNLGLVALNTLLLRLLFPAAAVGMATLADDQGWGLLNHFQAPAWLAIPVAVIALDFVIWLQHVMVHAIPALWRLHRVHHADPDYDVTTGSRFHPLEIILSMLIKFTAIVLLGPPVVAVFIFEVLLNATAMFNHGNVRLPAKLDRFLRWFVVTPDMHRVHHSIEDDETNSNFGFNLPWWDRLFGTYRDQPRGGHEGMAIGIRGYNQPRDVSWLPGMIVLPFRGKVAGYVINRRQWTDPKSLHEEATAPHPQVRAAGTLTPH
jgi:sterol desaturase/sphingolipid hydroxylase (fatty acid hydroxylase superfamily)